MCCPFGYQVFVFVDRVFAGTLSPQPMLSRYDGAGSSGYLYGADQLTAEFLRYAEDDARCCPSRVSDVSYRIERRGKLPVVVPVSAFTRPAAK